MSHLYDDHYEDVWRYDHFMSTIQQKARMSEDEAQRAAQAVLTTLGERISEGRARDLAAALPSSVRPWLLDGPASAEPFGAEDFVRRVAEREGTDTDTAERHARAVFIALARLVRGDEIADLEAELPKDYAPLLAPAVGGRRGTSQPEILTHEELVDRVGSRAGLDDERAARAVEAVLETLAERVDGGEVDDLAEALPDELRPALERGKERNGGKARRMSLDEFAGRIAEREGVSWEDALEHARAVFATLHEALPARELSDLLAQLPRGYQEALP